MAILLLSLRKRHGCAHLPTQQPMRRLAARLSARQHSRGRHRLRTKLEALASGIVYDPCLGTLPIIGAQESMHTGGTSPEAGPGDTPPHGCPRRCACQACMSVCTSAQPWFWVSRYTRAPRLASKANHARCSPPAAASSTNEPITVQSRCRPEKRPGARKPLGRHAQSAQRQIEQML